MSDPIEDADGLSHGAGTAPGTVSQTDSNPDLFNGSPLRNAATALRRVLNHDAERSGVQLTSLILLARNMAEDLIDIIDELEREKDARRSRFAPPPASVPRCLGGVKIGEGSFGVPSPLTPEEAEAEAGPDPDARIAEIVRYATGGGTEAPKP